jgi:hypothetical protein
MSDIAKADLHIHIDGTLEPAMVFELAARNDVALPYRSVDELKTRYSFSDLQSFLNIYYANMAVLRTKRDSTTSPRPTSVAPVPREFGTLRSPSTRKLISAEVSVWKRSWRGCPPRLRKQAGQGFPPA